MTNKVIKDEFNDAVLDMTNVLAECSSKSPDSRYINSLTNVSAKLYDLINYCNSVDKTADLKKATHWLKKEPKGKANGVLNALDAVKNIMIEKEKNGQEYTDDEKKASKAVSGFMGKVISNQDKWLDFLPQKVLLFKLETAIKAKLERYQDRFNEATKEPIMKDDSKLAKQ